MAFNNLWHITYVIVLNFILFEYSFPLYYGKEISHLQYLFLGIVLLFLYMMLFSYGAYVWREIGIAIAYLYSIRYF